MLNKGDVKIIKNIVSGAIGVAVAPLATKDDIAKLDTKITKLDVKMSGQFANLRAKTTKDTNKLEKAIKKEHKIGNIDFGYLEKEDRKILVRVEKIEHHLGFAPVSA